ncbi:hypothetical protein [Comamonas sp. lk]|uniref:hypothetical protein n=1 Tax=Comamonas sp. lk TaxID=2201272 RepID=UPI000EAF9E2E|nr:hypothetical protein [Comamonas sp. lk]
MVTLTPEQFDHAIRMITALCLVMGMLGALLMQVLQSVVIGLCTKVIYLIDRKHRIDMSRKRAARWRRLGQRFVGVADRMDARQAAKAAEVDQRPLICRGMFPEHDWDAVVVGDEVYAQRCRGCGQEPA